MAEQSSEKKEKKSKEEKAQEYIQKLYREHKGDWLDWDVVKEYQERVKKLNIVNFEYIGEIRRLGRELQEKYDILEIEAVNILQGHHVSFYVDKYQRIKNGIPLDITPGSKLLEDD